MHAADKMRTEFNVDLQITSVILSEIAFMSATSDQRALLWP